MAVMRDEVLTILRAEQPRLRSEFGVKSLALFGSVARAEASDSSDVDLLVEYERPVSLFDHVGTALYLEEALGVSKVDLIIRDCVIDELKDQIYGEAIDVFGTETVEVPDSAHVGGDREHPGIDTRHGSGRV
jgi:predicted nucleotidyltransferase